MSTWQVFRWPLVIGVITLAGLVAGLVSDGWGDALAGFGLLLPSVVAMWLALRSG